MNSMTVLAVVKAINTGTLAASTALPLVQRALESGEDVSMADLEEAATRAGDSLDALRATIAAKEAEAQGGG